MLTRIISATVAPRKTSSERRRTVIGDYRGAFNASSTLPSAAASAALQASQGQVKVAVVMLLAGVDATAARQRLDAAEGSVHGALA